MLKKIIKSKDVERNLNLEEKVKKGPVSSKAHVISDHEGGILNKKTLDATSKAREIVNEAGLEAERIRSEAESLLKQVDAELESARKRGFAKGQDEGLSSVTEKLVAIERIKEEFYKSAEGNIIKLVMMVAEKVIGKIVQEQVSAIKSIVKQALESSLGDRILVRVNPADYKTVTDAEAEFRNLLDRTKRLTFKEDSAIEQGGCVVETEVGTIDARLETQLKAIKKALEL